jgi:hypothetical protein
MTKPTTKIEISEEYLKYLENYVQSGDGERCEECGEVRDLGDLDNELYKAGRKVCESCAGYQKLLNRLDEEAAEDMRRHGSNHANFCDATKI